MRHGLDKSIVEQFFIWLGSVLEGNFGTSIPLRQNVLAIVLNRLPATLELSLLVLVLATVMGTLLAFTATAPSWREKSPPKRPSTWRLAGAGASVPDFSSGAAPALTLGVAFLLFEISGRVSPRQTVPFAISSHLIEEPVRRAFDITSAPAEPHATPAPGAGAAARRGDRSAPETRR